MWPVLDSLKGCVARSAVLASVAVWPVEGWATPETSLEAPADVGRTPAPGETASVESSPPSAPSAPNVPPALLLVVRAPRAKLEPQQLQRAIGEELGVVVTLEPATPHVAVLEVEEASGESVAVRYRSVDGATRLERQVALPWDQQRRVTVLVWIAGNLARDEAGELLTQLLVPSSPSPSPVDSADRAAPELPAAAAAPEPPPVSVARVEARPLLIRATVEPVWYPQRWVNLAVWHPYLAVWRTAGQSRFILHLGLGYGEVGGIDGLGFDLLVHRDRGSVRGVAMGGLWNHASGETRGAHFGGVGVSAHGTLHGAEAAGLLVLRDGSVRGTQLSAGINSTTGQLDGAALSGIANFASGKVQGGQFTAGLNRAEEVTGTQMSGIANWASGKVQGGQFTAGLNRAEEVTGLQVSGVANWASGRVQGGQFTVGLSRAEEVTGPQVSGVANWASGKVQGGQFTVGLSRAEEVTGPQVSGVANFASGKVQGGQFTVGLNRAEDVVGAQFGVANLADDMTGAQFGGLNVAGNMTGAQFGVVNVAKRADGLMFGLVNWADNIRLQPQYFLESNGMHNLGLRSSLTWWASSIAVGYDSADSHARAHFGLGPQFESGRFTVDGEFGYGWVLERFPRAPIDRAHTLDLRLSLRVDIVRRWLGVFGGGAVVAPVSGRVPITPDPRWFAGVSLL